MMRIKHTRAPPLSHAITNEVRGRGGFAHRRPAARGVPRGGWYCNAVGRRRGESAARGRGKDALMTIEKRVPDMYDRLGVRPVIHGAGATTATAAR